MAKVLVAAFYQFSTLDDFARLRSPLLACMRKHGIRGSILLAREGVNGTIAGTRDGVHAVLAKLRSDPRLYTLEHKESHADENPFLRAKVRLKNEIVSLGREEADPQVCVGEYVPSEAWNRVISDPETLVIDTRNHYEYAVGTFRNALNPDTESFRDFPDYVAEHLDPKQHKRVAMFCTGGIRCEKATSLMLRLGFENVLHLKGGILKYLETIPPEESLWEGECFVFDNRVTVNHALEPGSYTLCPACRMPLSETDQLSEHYEAGVSCPHCHDKRDATDRARFAERQKQIALARARGQEHLGASMPEK